MLHCMSPLLAQSGHVDRRTNCSLLELKPHFRFGGGIIHPTLCRSAWAVPYFFTVNAANSTAKASANFGSTKHHRISSCGHSHLASRYHAAPERRERDATRALRPDVCRSQIPAPSYQRDAGNRARRAWSWCGLCSVTCNLSPTLPREADAIASSRFHHSSGVPSLSRLCHAS